MNRVDDFENPIAMAPSSRKNKVKLLSLPNELLYLIVQRLPDPDDLENTALTCKHLYAICLRYLPQHNRLRTRFRQFKYSDYKRLTGDLPISAGFPLGPPYTVYSAYELLALIAVEPDVALHIKHADLSSDSVIWFGSGRPQKTTNKDHDNAVKGLLSNSPYFNGLDTWEKYYDQIKSELQAGEGGYSGCAAAFLLTLLPNVKALRMPILWRSGVSAPDKLMKLVTSKAREPGSETSLSKVTFLSQSGGGQASIPRSRFDGIGSGACLFRLPKLHKFVSRFQPSWDARELDALSLTDLPVDSTVETMSLEYPLMDIPQMGVFLSSCPNLKRFQWTYHNPDRIVDRPGQWDICKAIEEIKQAVGGHLEDLRLIYEKVYGISHDGGREETKKDPLAPGKASLVGFPKLHTLHLPLEVIAISLRARPYETRESLLREIIPRTVKVLSLSSFGRGWEATALENVYRFLKGERRVLEKFTLVSNEHRITTHERRFDIVCKNLKNMGVKVHREIFEGGVEWL